MIARARARHAKEAGVQDGAEQRRDAVAVGELEIRAALDEHACDVELAFARGVQQRRLGAAGRKALAAAFGPAGAHDADAFGEARRRLARRNEARRLLGRRRRIDVRARVEQAPHERDVPVPRRDHQRGLAEARVARVDGDAMLEQRSGDVDVADARRLQ